MSKLLKGLLIILIVLFLGQLIFERTFTFPKQIEYGVSFSPQYAGYLGLDWQNTYLQILDELKVRNLRLPSYWDILQPEEGKWDFSQTDFMISEAAKRRAKVILVLGARQPRWPECYIPPWAKNLGLVQRQQKTLEFIQKVIERYRQNLSIWAWQVENELFLTGFGEECDSPDSDFLKSEIALVRKLDNRKVIVTDSGELGWWINSMRLSDVFGTSLYRVVHSPVLGYINYPILPYFYNLKSALAHLFAPANQKTIIVELQAEPWKANNDFKNPQKLAETFPAEELEGNVNFAQKTGFDEIYFWGVEWWYFMADNGHPEYLQFAKTLFSSSSGYF